MAGANWPILLGLVDKSLVETRGDNRFDLHELTRQYAIAKLAETGQVAATQAAHFAAYEALARQVNHWFTSPKAAASFRRSHQEHDNYRAALRWGLDNEAIEAALEFLRQKLHGLVGEGLGDGRHLAHTHQHLDDFGRANVEGL